MWTLYSWAGQLFVMEWNSPIRTPVSQQDGKYTSSITPYLTVLQNKILDTRLAWQELNHAS
jgi:hypothetical protein